MKSPISYVLLLLLLMGSCRTSKVTPTQGTNKGMLKEAGILERHQHAFPDFETLTGSLMVTYSKEGKGQSVILSFRMKKGEAIWLSAPLGLAKALITKDKVQFYNKLNGTYFEGDYSILEKYVGIPLGFKQVENMLMGQLIFEDEQASIGIEGEYYDGKIDKEPLLIRFCLNPNLRMESFSVEQDLPKRSLVATYSYYQQVDQQFFPRKLTLQGKEEGGQELMLSLIYTSLQRNVAVKFPYSVPSGYQPLTLRP
ncbi:MAG: DUF4292 domain-containing protein [Capnocytophaga sp.]|nr:MAG: DUF4292 domain-containing protein [Capnocytophaga sp.]